MLGKPATAEPQVWPLHCHSCLPSDSVLLTQLSLCILWHFRAFSPGDLPPWQTATQIPWTGIPHHPLLAECCHCPGKGAGRGLGPTASKPCNPFPLELVVIASHVAGSDGVSGCGAVFHLAYLLHSRALTWLGLATGTQEYRGSRN